MVRNHQGAMLEAEGTQILHVIRSGDFSLISRKDDALITISTRVPLESQEGHEVRILIRLLRQSDNLWPRVPKLLETPHPGHLAAAFHRAHVVPAGMTGERKKIQVLFRDVYRSFEGSLAVS